MYTNAGTDALHVRTSGAGACDQVILHIHLLLAGYRWSAADGTIWSTACQLGAHTTAGSVNRLSSLSKESRLSVGTQGCLIDVPAEWISLQLLLLSISPEGCLVGGAGVLRQSPAAAAAAAHAAYSRAQLCSQLAPAPWLSVRRHALRAGAHPSPQLLAPPAVPCAVPCSGKLPPPRWREVPVGPGANTPPPGALHGGYTVCEVPSVHAVRPAAPPAMLGTTSADQEGSWYGSAQTEAWDQSAAAAEPAVLALGAGTPPGPHPAPAWKGALWSLSAHLPKVAALPAEPALPAVPAMDPCPTSGAAPARGPGSPATALWAP